MNLVSVEEFIHTAKLLFRYAKRVTLEDYKSDEINEVVRRNRRVGTSVTGCLGSPLFTVQNLDRAYAAIQEEDRVYSSQLNIPLSVRTTTCNPGGTVSKVLDQAGYEGIHASFSRYMIQRIRFSTEDALVPVLRAAGHKVEPEVMLDGSKNQGTMVVDFYQKAPDGMPVADEDWDTWKQLDVLKMAQRHWADQAVSVTAYYRREDIQAVKEWLRNNIQEIKSVSFLCHNDHGFKQAPKEAITKEQYEQATKKLKPLALDNITMGDLESLECVGGVCPVK
jgi:hypothetical protein